MERMGMTVVPVSKEEELLNDFAFRCFREVADADYITARMAYRARLWPQFHWSGLQAIEKYLKSLLLLNRIPAPTIRHDLLKALEHCDRLPFKLELSETSREVIQHLAECGENRYLVWSYAVVGPKLQAFDRAVWEIRRYCRVLDWTGESPDGTHHRMLQAEIDLIKAAEKASPTKVWNTRGLLEVVVDQKLHPARRGLLWRNSYFGSRSRRALEEGFVFHFVNAPLTLNPQILDRVREYVYLPSDAVKAYREHLKKQQARQEEDE